MRRLIAATALAGLTLLTAGCGKDTPPLERKNQSTETHAEEISEDKREYYVHMASRRNYLALGYDVNFFAVSNENTKYKELRSVVIGLLDIDKDGCDFCFDTKYGKLTGIDDNADGLVDRVNNNSRISAVEGIATTQRLTEIQNEISTGNTPNTSIAFMGDMCGDGKINANYSTTLHFAGNCDDGSIRRTLRYAREDLGLCVAEIEFDGDIERNPYLHFDVNCGQ